MFDFKTGGCFFGCLATYFFGIFFIAYKILYWTFKGIYWLLKGTLNKLFGNTSDAILIA